jgi:hypothetical protein
MLSSSTRIVDAPDDCIWHCIGAKWRMLWMYVLGREWWLNYLLHRAPIGYIFRDIWEVCMVRMP